MAPITDHFSAYIYTRNGRVKLADAELTPSSGRAAKGVVGGVGGRAPARNYGPMRRVR